MKIDLSVHEVVFLNADYDVALYRHGRLSRNNDADSCKHKLPTIGKQKQNLKRQYDTNLLWKAYRDVTVNGVSVYKASRVYGIPESTLRDRTLGLQPAVESIEDLPKSGASAVFTRAQEKLLVDHVSYMTNIGYGYSRGEFLTLVTDYANILGSRSPSDSALTQSWFNGFRKRNPEITLTKPQKLSIVRAKSTSEEVLDKYFVELKSVMDKYGITGHPDRIWNTDETGLQMEHSPLNVVSIKGVKPQAITSNRVKTVTLIAAGSATGMRIPPYFVFPGKRWNADLLNEACPGSAGIMTESGWSNSSVCMDFFENHFKKHIPIPTGDQKVLVLFDGHKSHINLTLANWGEANNIAFFVLPPHTSHITQPLDVGCFGPFKNAFYTECQHYLRKHPGMQINRYNITEIACKAYNKGITPENLISSFRKTGIYPLNRKEITKEKSAPASIYRSASDENTSNDLDIDGESFLNSKKITSIVVEKTTKRKCMPSLTGDIISPSKKVFLKEMSNTIPSTGKKGQKKGSSVKKSGPKQKTVSQVSPVPCTSGVNNIISDDSDFSDNELHVSEEDKCCVCGKSTPDSFTLEYQLEFIQWAQCDECGHWTHLTYEGCPRKSRTSSIFLRMNN